MIDLSLSDEQKALRELAHDFAVKEIRPVAWGVRQGLDLAAGDHREGPRGLLMNVHIPEEYGGAGLSYLDGCLFEEEIPWGCSGIGTSLGANGLSRNATDGRSREP
jgi:acyl-CoA dehydrogenase